MKRAHRTWVWAVGFLIGSVAQAAPEFIPLQGKAQGQSLTGASQLNDSLYTNPAASSFTNVYALDGTFQMPRTFAVSILDTKTSGMGGGIGYFRTTQPDGGEMTHGARLSLAGRLSDTLGFGLGGKLLWGPGQTSKRSEKLTDLDIGMLSMLGSFQIGFVSRNTLGGSAELGQQREWSTGVRWGWEDTVFVNASTTAKWENLKPYEYGFGAEYVSPYYFSIKGGYRMQPENSLSFWSAGVSFISPRLSVHYAAEFPQQPNSKIDHVIGTTLLF